MNPYSGMTTVEQQLYMRLKKIGLAHLLEKKAMAHQHAIERAYKYLYERDKLGGLYAVGSYIRKGIGLSVSAPAMTEQWYNRYFAHKKESNSEHIGEK